VHIPSEPRGAQHAIGGPLPILWAGWTDRDVDAEPWMSAPLGSIYVYINGTTSAKAYCKVAANDADADWSDMTD